MKSLPTWKKLALGSLFGGIGFAAVLAAVAGTLVLYRSRPIPPKPWNTSALVASTKAPYFYTLSNNDGIHFNYRVTNNTDSDYSLDDEATKRLKVTFKSEDGAAVSHPIGPKDPDTTLDSPVFIPARRTGELTLSINISDYPRRRAIEAEKDYQDRLEKWDKTDFPIPGFVLFDEATRYEIDLPSVIEKTPITPDSSDKTKR
jgi:hypothetical protein